MRGKYHIVMVAPVCRGAAFKKKCSKKLETRAMKKQETKKRNKKVWIFAGLILLLFLWGRNSSWAELFTSGRGAELLKETVEKNFWQAAGLYLVFTVVGSVVLALPGITFAVLAGLLFGPVLGTFFCVLAATAGAALAFAAGRFFLRDTVKPMAVKNPYLKKWLFDESGKNQMFVLMITRLVPLFPYNLQNFAYGATDISFWAYLAGSFVFMIPGTAMYTVGTAGLADSENRVLYLGTAALLAAAVFCLGLFLKKKYVSGESGEEADASARSTEPKELNPAAGNRRQDGGCLDAADRAERDCIHCHICQEHCGFLKKYHLDLGDTERFQELSYHCFLCGSCASVCPKHIDGREVSLALRRRQVREAGGKLKEKGYGFLLLEKKKYLFSSYKNAGSESVLFPGCNFPSFYPETTRYLAGLLKREAGMGVIFDCCGKPVAELGLQAEETRILKELDRKFSEAGAKEIVALCPNCYHFLKGRLSMPVVGIYEKLQSLGLGGTIENAPPAFMPCPDREEKELFHQIQAFAKEPLRQAEGCQCCGLGGCAAGKEKELASSMCSSLNKEEPVMTYCASCSGSLARKGCQDVDHALVKLLGTEEKPDTGSSLLNRMKVKFWKLHERNEIS